MNRKALLVGSFVAGLIFTGPTAFAKNPNPGVLPPHSNAYGMTYGEWSAAWWQWAFSLPVDHHPLFFTYGPLPDNNVLQFFGVNAPAGATSLSAADGFYLLLAPLSVGPHTIHFTGTFGDPINFTLDITYNLTVAPRKP